MGSKNTGRFTDYPGTTSGSSSPVEVQEMAVVMVEMEAQAIKIECLRVINNVSLEEVSRAEYFLHIKLFPSGYNCICKI